MRLPGRRPKPTSVAQLEAGAGRSLAWGLTADDEPVIATDEAFVIGGPTPMQLPWHLIDRASWEPPVLTIRYRDAATGVPGRIALELAQHGEMPPVVRERVTRSVLVSRRVDLADGLGAVLAARRDAAGQVRWTVVLDPGLDASDPRIVQRAREELAELRRSYGA